MPIEFHGFFEQKRGDDYINCISETNVKEVTALFHRLFAMIPDSKPDADCCLTTSTQAQKMKLVIAISKTNGTM